MKHTALIAQLLLLLTASSSLAAAVQRAEGLKKRACTEPSKHIEWRSLTNEQKTAYVQAERCLFKLPGKTGLPGATNRNQDLAAVHQLSTTHIHENGPFLPWHRFMLFAHERLLRSECGYTGPMTWWDESKDAGKFQHADLFSPDWFGTLPPTNSCVTDGAFANQYLDVGPLNSTTHHCLSRASNELIAIGSSSLKVDLCNLSGNYTTMWNCVYHGPHSAGHEGIGGVMEDLNASPGDPVFYMHHGFIDRNWYQWQKADPANRRYQINGYTEEQCKTGCRETTLDDDLDIFNIVGGVKIRDMMDTEGSTLCYTYDY